MEAVTRPQQKVDFEYERKAMQDEAETSYNAFFATSEVTVRTAASGQHLFHSFLGEYFTRLSIGVLPVSMGVHCMNVLTANSACTTVL